MGFIFGRFIKRESETPRVISEDQLRAGEARVGDLVEFAGGCPRFPGDKCDLVGGYKSVIYEYKGELYYRIIA